MIEWRIFLSFLLFFSLFPSHQSYPLSCLPHSFIDIFITHDNSGRYLIYLPNFDELGKLIYKNSSPLLFSLGQTNISPLFLFFFFLSNKQLATLCYLVLNMQLGEFWIRPSGFQKIDSYLKSTILLISSSGSKISFFIEFLGE